MARKRNRFASGSGESPYTDPISFRTRQKTKAITRPQQSTKTEPKLEPEEPSRNGCSNPVEPPLPICHLHSFSSVDDASQTDPQSKPTQLGNQIDDKQAPSDPILDHTVKQGKQFLGSRSPIDCFGYLYRDTSKTELLGLDNTWLSSPSQRLLTHPSDDFHGDNSIEFSSLIGFFAFLHGGVSKNKHSESGNQRPSSADSPNTSCRSTNLHDTVTSNEIHYSRSISRSPAPAMPSTGRFRRVGGIRRSLRNTQKLEWILARLEKMSLQARLQWYLSDEGLM